MSRSTKKSYINLIDYKPQVSIGYIYKITDTKGKNYIGSTIDYKKRWKQHEEAGEEMPLHRAIKDQGIENHRNRIYINSHWYTNSLVYF